MRIITICGFLAMAAIMSIGRQVVATVERIVYPVVHFVGDLFVEVLRADYGNAASLDRWLITQFRVIGLLKPEYDDSLETDGQNLESRYRLAMNC